MPCCSAALLTCLVNGLLTRYVAKRIIISQAMQAGGQRKQSQTDTSGRPQKHKNARARGLGGRGRGRKKATQRQNATKRYFSYPTPPNATEPTGKRERAWARTGMVAQPHDTEHHRTPPKATESERTAPNESKRQQTPANAK